jgi:transcriptional regulator with XRE-family HTH domain
MKIKKSETYGSFLLRIRETAKITQEELALRLGVSEMSVLAWENGRNPSFASKRAIDEFAKTIK